MASVIAAGALSLSVTAGVHGNPYDVIVLRNAFGLRPIPPPGPAATPAIPAAPRPEIKITGITTLLGAPRAMFQYEDKEAKKVEFPPLLAEGQSYKELTLVSIDAENSRVQIRNGDAEMTLDFFRNGVKPAAPSLVSAPAAPPALPTGNADARVIVAGPGPTVPRPGGPLPPETIARLRQRLLEQQVLQN
jgi:hypothetical protein